MTRCPQCGQSFPENVKLCPNDGSVLEHQPTAATQLGKILDGKYRLDAFLSHGGMGSVYRATHVMLGKTMAVKLINPELVTSPDIVRRFQREARAATALNHPNIVGVYDLGQTAEGTLYIAMEFVDGPSLKSAIEQGGSIAPVRTIAILRQVASALAAAHRHNIIHRDLKPHNIMLARSEDGHEVAKLVDFGIAKTFDEATQLTQTGFALGTPQYMAPEQAEGLPVDARSDLYSLGVILYEMLSGDVPFNDNSAPAILIKHIKEAPQPPSAKNPRVFVPPELEAIAMRCLEKDPARRFQRAEEFAAALEQAAAAIPGAAASMQPTVPMAAVTPAPPAATPAWNTPTVAAPGTQPLRPATQPIAPTAQIPSTAPAPPPAATRATAVQPQAAAAAAAAAQPVQPAKKGRPLMTLAAIAIIAIVLGGIGAVILARQMAAARNQTASADTPAGQPAMATPNEPPATPPQTTPPAADAAATTPAASTTAAALPTAASTTPPPVTPTPATPPPTTTSTAAAPTASAPSRAGGAPVASVPAVSAATAVAGGTAAGPTKRPAATGRPSAGIAVSAPAATSQTAAGGETQARQQPPPTAFPENPSVFFQCGGDPQICSALRAAVDDALEKSGLSAVRNPTRGDVHVTARVQGLQEKVSQQFQTTFAVRSYSIEVSAEAPQSGDAVSMPPSTTLSFDPQFGAERANEKARVVAGDIVDKVKAYARRKHGG